MDPRAPFTREELEMRQMWANLDGDDAPAATTSRTRIKNAIQTRSNPNFYKIARTIAMDPDLSNNRGQNDD